MPPPANERGLTLLLDEYFAAGDDRFLETLRQITSIKALAAFADRWKKDPRPWARQQILAYLHQPLNCPGHQPIVKRLFKQAEEMKDDELMAEFMVAFDLLVRRVMTVQSRWDRSSRTVIQDDVLIAPRNTLINQLARNSVNPVTGGTILIPERASRVRPNSRLFSYRTRYYLRRRVWRYFRRAGFQRPTEYPKLIARALKLYHDDDLAKGENILDSWALMNACFRGHEALEFTPREVRVKEGRSLSELSPAPRFPAAWRAPESAPILFSLISDAQSRVVRVWAMGVLRREHTNWLPSPEDLLRLLDHQDSEIQQFGAAQLASFPGLEKMPVTFWLRLLKVRDATILQSICDALQKHVSVARLDLAQCLELACSKPAPVARLGLQFLKQRTINSAEERNALAKLADAKCPIMGKDIGTWALGILGAKEFYQADQVVRFFDSLLEEVRLAAWEWLVGAKAVGGNGAEKSADQKSAGYDDPVLWSRLIETPFDDLRLRLVDHLETRAKLPGSAAGQLNTLWCAVLLGVHRGGRQKAKAVRQIGEAMERDPASVGTLLPVLTVAVRSVRLPEARAGLAAVVSAVEARPELAAAVKRYLPELELSSEEAAR